MSKPTKHLERKDTARIPATQATKQRLKVLVAEKGFRNYEEALVWLLKGAKR